MVAESKIGTSLYKGAPKGERHYYPGRGQGLKFITLMEEETRKVGLLQAISKSLGLEVSCVDPDADGMQFVQWAHKFELDRVAIFEGKKGKGMAMGRTPHQEGSTLMARIQNMIVAYGTTVKVEVTKDSVTDETVVAEVPAAYPTQEVNEAKKWLKKNASNAAIFLVN
jgi:hypothetical protein